MRVKFYKVLIFAPLCSRQSGKTIKKLYFILPSSLTGSYFSYSEQK